MGILLVVLLLMLLFTTTAFAQNSLPGQALYALKLTSERAWRTAAPDPIKVDLTLANRRTDELVRLVSNKNASAHNASWNPNAESDAIAAYTDVLNRLDAETTEQNGDEILGLLEEHQSALSKAGVHVPRLDDLLQRAQSRKGEPTKPGSRP